MFLMVPAKTGSQRDDTPTGATTDGRRQTNTRVELRLLRISPRSLAREKKSANIGASSCHAASRESQGKKGIITKIKRRLRRLRQQDGLGGACRTMPPAPRKFEIVVRISDGHGSWPQVAGDPLAVSAAINTRRPAKHAKKNNPAQPVCLFVCLFTDSGSRSSAAYYEREHYLQ